MSNFACTNCGKFITPDATYGTYSSGSLCLACYSEPSLPTFGPVAVYQRTPEEVDKDPLSQWAKHAVLSDHNLSHADAIAALREWVDTLETLLASYHRIIDALPPCPKHGAGCVCQAKLWIDRAKAVMRETGGEHGR